jgi:arginine decarboxylase
MPPSCDITCDSDGVVDKFVDLHDVKQVLELHALVPGRNLLPGLDVGGRLSGGNGETTTTFSARHMKLIFTLMTKAI